MSNADNEQLTLDIQFGAPLREARQARKMAIAEISELMKVPEAMIESIERSETAQLPPPAFTRGYLRAYARFVEIDDTAVLACYANAVPQDTPPGPRCRLPGEPDSQSPLVKTITYILLILGGFAVIYGGVQYYSHKAGEMQVDVKQRVEKHTGKISSLDTPKLKPLPSKPRVEQQASLDEEGELVVHAEYRAEAATPVTPAVSGPPPAAGERIRFFASQGAWLELHDGKRKRLHYDMIPKNKWIAYQGRGPFRVSLGNARSTKVEFNGEIIDISPYTRPNNIAQFSVGEQRRNGRSVVHLEP